MARLPPDHKQPRPWITSRGSPAVRKTQIHAVAVTVGYGRLSSACTSASAPAPTPFPSRACFAPEAVAFATRDGRWESG